MDVSELLPILWNIVDNKKCAINVSYVDNRFSVSIIRKTRIERFNHSSQSELISQLNQYMQA